jgi:hypothetical protein
MGSRLTPPQASAWGSGNFYNPTGDMMTEHTNFDPTNETDFDPRKYRPSNARQAEKLLLLGAKREELRKWFGVHEVYLDEWAGEHEAFALAMATNPSSLAVGDEYGRVSYGLVKWLYDYRRGAM